MSQVWFVTGTSVGLGRAIAEAALEAGHRVAATARTPRGLDDLVARYPDRMLALSLDVTCAEDWGTAVSSTLHHFGRIDVLVNNAGFGAVGSVEEMPMTLVREQIETNLLGAIAACQAVVPAMRAQRSGRIILVSSIGARIATPGAAVYYATKAAVSSLAESLALEVAPFGIAVTAVEPGGMRTRFAEPASLKLSPFDAAYHSTVGATLAMMRSPAYTAALHDPAGHAAVILELGQMAAPPTRLLAGKDAVEYGAAAGHRRAESDLRWRTLGESAWRTGAAARAAV